MFTRKIINKKLQDRDENINYIYKSNIEALNLKSARDFEKIVIQQKPDKKIPSLLFRPF